MEGRAIWISLRWIWILLHRALILLCRILVLLRPDLEDRTAPAPRGAIPSNGHRPQHLLSPGREFLRAIPRA
jgi:hypothetical protein